MATDIFGRLPLQIGTPLTADACKIRIDSTDVAEAYQVQLDYQQQVTRRRSIGNQAAVIYGSQPIGRLTVGRLMTESTKIPETATFNGCGKGEVTISLSAKPCDAQAQGPSNATTYTLKGCMVTSYTLQIQAEDLTVIDGITIEFLEMLK